MRELDAKLLLNEGKSAWARIRCWWGSIRRKEAERAGLVNVGGAKSDGYGVDGDVHHYHAKYLKSYRKLGDRDDIETSRAIRD